MGLRRDIDRALEAIGYHADNGGLGRFRKHVVELTDAHLAIQLGALGTRVVAHSRRANEQRVERVGDIEIDRHGQVLARRPREARNAIGEPLATVASSLASVLGQPSCRFDDQIAAPAHHATFAVVACPAHPLLRQRIGRLLALRALAPALRANALVAFRDINKDGVDVSVAASSGGLLPELFIRSRATHQGVELVAKPWFPPMAPAIVSAVAGAGEVSIELAISTELGLGVSLELGVGTVALETREPPPGVGALAVLAHTADIEMPAELRAAFQHAVLEADPHPLPGRTPSASRAHAQQLARKFATTGVLTASTLPPSAIRRAGELAERIGIARAVVASATG